MIAECEADEQQGKITGLDGRVKPVPRGPKVIRLIMLYMYCFSKYTFQYFKIAVFATIYLLGSAEVLIG